MSDSSQRVGSAASAFRSRNFRFYQSARLLGILYLQRDAGLVKAHLETGHFVGSQLTYSLKLTNISFIPPIISIL